MTPAQKAAATRADNEAKRAKSEAVSKANAPVRKAWKDVRTMLRSLGSRLRPSLLPERWQSRTPEQREADIVEDLNRVRKYVEIFERVKIEVRAAKAAGKKPRAKALGRAGR